MMHLLNAEATDASWIAFGCLGLVLLIQTSLLLGPGGWGLNALHKRKPSAATLLGHLLFFATLSLAVLSTGATLSSSKLLPTIWNVRLPLAPQQTVPLSNIPDSIPTAAIPSITAPSRAASSHSAHTILPQNNQSLSRPQKAVSPSPSLVANSTSISSGLTPASPEHVTGLFWVQLATVTWLGGALLLFVWLVLCHVVLWRLRHGAHPVHDARMLSHLHRVCEILNVPAPSLLSHPRVSSPFLTGLLRPAIVLPLSVSVLSDEVLEAVLFHEVAHLKRHDLWWNMLGRVLCALLWPQPLLWLLCRQWEHICEEACDATVLQAGCSPQQYANCLLDWAQRQMPQRSWRVAGAGVLTGRSSLARRVQSILGANPKQNLPLSRSAKHTMITVIVAAVVAMPLLVASNPLPSGSQTHQVTNPKDATSPSTNLKKQPLKPFATIDGYRLYVNGVSRGVLQGISLYHEQKNGLIVYYLARSLQRQSGNGGTTSWLMTDGASYTFKREGGFVAQTKFERLNLNFPTQSAFEKFLIQQTQGAPETAPVSTAKFQQWQKALGPPLDQIDKLEKWVKSNGNATLTGRVVAEDGTPLSGVKVEIHIFEQALQGIVGSPKNEGYGRIYSYDFALSKAARTVLGQNATTGSDGTYRFESLGAVPYRLDIASYGRIARFDYDVPPPAQILTASHQVVPRSNQTTAAPDLKLTRGGLVNVRVEDKDTGVALSDVMVYASSRKGSPPYDYGHAFTVDSDAKGQSLFRLPSGEGSVGIAEQYLPEIRGSATSSKSGLYKRNKQAEVVIDGGAPQTFTGAAKVQVSTDQTREVVIRLQRYVAPIPTPTPKPLPPPPGKGSLIGRVVNEAGVGVAGIPVLALIQQKAQWRLMQGAGLAYSNNDTPNFDRKWASIQGVLYQSTKTRTDGSFRFDGLTTAPYNLIVATSNGSFGLTPPARWVAPAVEGAWAKEGQVVRRTSPLVVTQGALIEGRILDKATGLPLGGISIGSNGPQLPMSTDNVMSANTDSQGRFSLRVAPGTTSLYIAGPWNNNSAVYADDGKSADNEARIVTSRGLFAGSGNVPFELDGGPSQTGLNIKGRGEGRVQIPVQAGQTRHITLHLRRLKLLKPKDHNYSISQ